MKNIFKTIIVLICVYGFLPTFAQDIHFSQYSLAPLYLNPALTGIMEGNQRVALKYRNQWNSVLGAAEYQTYMLTYDTRWCPSNYSNYWAMGISLFADKAGTPSFSNYQGSISIAYHQQINRESYLSGAVKAGAVNYRIDVNGLLFNEQFDGFYLDPNLNSFEDFQTDQIYLFDLGLGVAYFNEKINNKDIGFQAGLALHHINRPTYSFINNNDTYKGGVLATRWVFHSNFTIPVSKKKVTLIPKLALLFQEIVGDSPHWQALPGVEIKVPVSKSKRLIKNIQVGMAARVGKRYRANNNDITADALILSSQLVFNIITIGVAYDVNISPLRNVSTYRGGIEISMMFNLEGEKGCTTCPTQF